MPKLLTATAIFSLFVTGVLGQQTDTAGTDINARQGPYAVKAKLEIPLTAVLTGWTVYSFSQISEKEHTSAEKIAGLTKQDVNGFDRWAIKPYNHGIDRASYIPFYASVPYPPVFMLLDKRMRKDHVKLLFMYTEAMSITGALYGSAAHYFPRLRPLVYDAKSPENVREASNSRNSFFAGHVALVGTATFFMAQVFADYHPESKLKWLVYGAAGVATAATGYMRHAAGEHFPSDILVGAAVGTFTGLLVPRLHKHKLLRNPKVSLVPYMGLASGLAAFYKL